MVCNRIESRHAVLYEKIKNESNETARLIHFCGLFLTFYKSLNLNRVEYMNAAFFVR